MSSHATQEEEEGHEQEITVDDAMSTAVEAKEAEDEDEELEENRQRNPEAEDQEEEEKGQPQDVLTRMGFPPSWTQEHEERLWAKFFDDFWMPPAA